MTTENNTLKGGGERWSQIEFEYGRQIEFETEMAVKLNSKSIRMSNWIRNGKGCQIEFEIDTDVKLNSKRKLLSNWIWNRYGRQIEFEAVEKGGGERWSQIEFEIDTDVK